MAENRVFKLRVTYGKTGRLAMLSHLELTHALERMVRRAALPFAVSQGFSPHMRIAFGSALPVGVGGTSEIFDIQLTDYVSDRVALDALCEAAPIDLMPISAKYIENGAKAASVAYPFSVYEAKLSGPVGELSVPEEIAVMRKGKEKVLDVREYLVGDIEVDGDRCTFELESKSTGSLRPDLLLEHALDGTGAHAVSITRISQHE